MSRTFRFVFYAAALFTLVMALLPMGSALQGEDKLQHAAAFFTLAVLGRLAFPRASLGWLLAALTALGAAIEIAQMTPGLGRHPDLADLATDVAAAAFGLAAASLLRRLFARG